MKRIIEKPGQQVLSSIFSMTCSGAKLSIIEDVYKADILAGNSA